MLGSGDKREKMMEGGEFGSWTVESLRGRLLAERAASKTAKEEAEFLGKKLIELESQLKLEIESRNKAEKKLKILTEKLRSMNLSEMSSTSPSPSPASSDVNVQLMNHLIKHETVELNHEKPMKVKHRSQELQLELKQSTEENHLIQEDQTGENTLALVPVIVNSISSPSSKAANLNDDGVRDVLATLRHAREQLERSMGRGEDRIVSHPLGICFEV